ncbi:hypothetical protein CUMW_028880 [Citrus unshiu]|nr:hypothetical protein CUMW_028880 [Citrus unshiu]
MAHLQDLPARQIPHPLVCRRPCQDLPHGLLPDNWGGESPALIASYIYYLERFLVLSVGPFGFAST